jgi:hypothetical protein
MWLRVVIFGRLILGITRATGCLRPITTSSPQLTP